MFGPLQSENPLSFGPGNDEGVHFAAVNGLQGFFGFCKAKAEDLNFV
jgi:hypothetical protein